MYHGSNTMFKKYTTASGTLKNGKRTDGKELLAGTAVFKYNSTDGYYHVGLYVGGNNVIEAKGTYYGVVASAPSTWSHWGELKGVEYIGSNTENESTKGTENGSMKATVTTSGGKLNLRKSTTTSSACLAQIPNGS